MFGIAVIILVGGWHTYVLARRGEGRDAWAAGCLWVATTVLTWAVVTRRSPATLDSFLRTIFGGLSAWLTGR